MREKTVAPCWFSAFKCCVTNSFCSADFLYKSWSWLRLWLWHNLSNCSR